VSHATIDTHAIISSDNTARNKRLPGVPAGGDGKRFCVTRSVAHAVPIAAPAMIVVISTTTAAKVKSEASDPVLHSGGRRHAAIERHSPSFSQATLASL